MNEKLITVVMTTYNHELYIKESILSVLNQTYNNIELIVVNDGSTDNTEKEIQSVSDPRLVYIYQNNNGPSAATNTGLNNATGDYIALMSGDDICYPSRLEEQYQAFIEDGGKKKILFSLCDFVNEESNLIDDVDHFAKGLFVCRNLNSHEALHEFFSLNNWFLAPSCFSSKEVFMECGNFNETLLQLQDLELWLKAAILNIPLVILDKPLIKYRVFLSGGNLSAIKPESSIRSSNEFFQILKLFLTINTKNRLLSIFPKSDFLFEHYKEIDDEPLLVHFCLAQIAFGMKTKIHNQFGLEILFKLFQNTRFNYLPNKFLYEYSGSAYVFENITTETLPTLYIDTGNGFNEESSLKFDSVQLTSSSSVINFDISNFNSIKRFRFDPLKGRLSKVKITNIRYELSGGSFSSYNLNDLFYNGVLIDSYIWFNHYHPYFIFELPDGVTNLSISYDCFVLTNDDIVNLYKINDELLVKKDRMISEIITEKDEIISEMHGMISEKDRIISEMHGMITEKDRLISEKHNELVSIYNSVSYRLIDKIRNISAVKFCYKCILKPIVLPFWKLYKFVFKRKVDVPKEGYTYHNPLKNKDYLRQVKKEIKSFEKKPLISIVIPVYNVDPTWLKLAINSIKKQVYKNWEICIADDCSTNEKTIKYLKSLKSKKIKVLFAEENGNISKASNLAANLASGDYLALLDNDDELTPDALYENVKLINQNNCDFIYSDEDKITVKNTYVEPHYKPDYSPDFLLSQNYICHFAVFKKSIFDLVGGFRTGYEGSQDHDLFLRIVENTDQIGHIPKVLYHWRTIPGSTAEKYDSKNYAWEAEKKAIQDALVRRNIEGTVSFGRYPGSCRVQRKINGNPLVSIIIPFKDAPDLLKTCIDSILSKSTYNNVEIIGISNNSELNDTEILMQKYEANENIHFYEYNHPFNYSEINNFAAQYAKGEYLLFLNNDIEVITPTWIEEFLQHSQRKEVGVVGAKLLYPDNTIQHGGMVLGIHGSTGHVHYNQPREAAGYFSRLSVTQNFTMVTAAAMMIRKSLFSEIGGFDPGYKVAYNDTDLCLRLFEKGFLNVWTPFAELYHHECKTRGYNDTKEKQDLCLFETDRFVKRWGYLIEKGDPYYNPNLSLMSHNFEIK